MEKAELKNLIREVLEQGYLMSLGTADNGGVWVADVIYIFDEEFNLYWMSDPEVRHSQAILVHPQAAGTITVSWGKDKELGLQFSGEVKKIEGPRYDLALKHYTKRDKSKPAEDEDVLEGDSWYILKPSTIELINGQLFGFEKQVYNLM